MREAVSEQKTEYYILARETRCAKFKKAVDRRTDKILK
jgi:hypothetical protein